MVSGVNQDQFPGSACENGDFVPFVVEDQRGNALAVENERSLTVDTGKDAAKVELEQRQSR
jgi:hypothetical protein